MEEKTKSILICIALILIVALTIYVRTPNIPNLKDVTTGNYTLAPDLDPFLYLRNAHEILAGTLNRTDTMWAAPVGAKSYAYINLMPWAIVGLYKFLNIFSPISLEYAAIILPVIVTCFAVLFFFLFVQKLFSFIMKKDNATIGALLASIFYVTIPQMLHRTTAGVPEIESLSMIFFWLALYFFICAWNKENNYTIYSLLAGLSTGTMIFVWGGYRYIFMIISLAVFLSFTFQKVSKKNILVFGLWLIPSLLAGLLRGYSPNQLVSSVPDFLFSSIVMSILVVDLIFGKYIEKKSIDWKIPRSVLSIALTLILGAIAATLLFDVLGIGYETTSFQSSFVWDKIKGLINYFITPFGKSRIGVSVAENMVPSFASILNAFAVNLGPNLRLSLFWFSLFGSALILYNVFRYEKIKGLLSQTKFSYLLLLSILLLAAISMRGAVRLLFILAPLVIIPASYFVARIMEYYTSENKKIYLILAVIFIVVFGLIALRFTQMSYDETKNTIPGYNEVQWQYAMSWARTNTSSNAIFASWWDYGYWIQTIGQRATMTDGGHAVPYWDHTQARYFLTTKNETTALNYIKTFNVSYVLFDPTDVSKYGAYSSIGSDKTGVDRLSWIPLFNLDDKQTQEKKNETTYIYVGGFSLDEDFMYNGEFLPQGLAIIPALFVDVSNIDNTIVNITAVVFYNNKRYDIPVNNYFINGVPVRLTNSGLNSALYIVPRLEQNKLNPIGSALYLSDKVMNSQFAKMYLLGFTNFTLAHKEDALILQEVNKYYQSNVEFISANGQLFGPIKIFKVPDNFATTSHPEYLDRPVLTDDSFAKLDYLGV